MLLTRFGAYVFEEGLENIWNAIDKVYCHANRHSWRGQRSHNSMPPIWLVGAYTWPGFWVWRHRQYANEVKQDGGTLQKTNQDGLKHTRLRASYWSKRCPENKLAALENFHFPLVGRLRLIMTGNVSLSTIQLNKPLGLTHETGTQNRPIPLKSSTENLV